MNYRDKTALITGASTGIGAAFAQALAKRGCHLVLVARSEERLQRLADQLSREHQVNCRVHSADLACLGAGEAVGRGLSEPIDILINNAGFGTQGSFQDLPLEVQRQEVLLNCMALMELTHVLLPSMQARHSGSIINVSSIASFQPVPYVAVYAATKAFVSSFSEALWAENRNTGVRVLSLCPGGTATEFFQRMDAISGRSGRTVNGATPDSVVESALKALEQDRCYVVPGWRNWILTLGCRILPRAWAVSMAARMARPR